MKSVPWFNAYAKTEGRNMPTSGLHMLFAQGQLANVHDVHWPRATSSKESPHIHSILLEAVYTAILFAEYAGKWAFKFNASAFNCVKNTYTLLIHATHA
jgi:hypothetical protein